MDNINDFSDESLELFPIEEHQGHSMFKYEDPSLFTGVIKAVTDGNVEKLQALITAGRSVNVNDNHGNTPLHIAVIKKNSEVMECLLKEDTLIVNSRNFYGETPLYIALKYKHIDIAKRLITSGANVNLPNNEDITPLHLAANEPGVAHILIKNGANIDAVDFSGDTPLHEATSSCCLEVVCMLLYYNADVNVQNDYNLTPFMNSLICEDIEIQTVLLEYVDDFCATTGAGMSILSLALTHTTPYVEEIIKRGANVNYHLDYTAPYDAFEMCCRVPNRNNFKLIWDRFINLEPERGITKRLCEANLEKEVFCDYLNIIVNSENVVSAAISPNLESDIAHLVTLMNYYTLPLKYITEVVCILLSYGKNVTSIDLHVIFDIFGYCELFKIALHMDIFRIDESRNFPRLIYDPRITVNSFIQLCLGHIDCEHGDFSVKNGIRMYNYCIFPKINTAYLASLDPKIQPIQEIIPKFPQIPCLLDLARNIVRDYIISLNNIKTSRQYMTYVNSMDLSKIYKQVLTFERQLYSSDAV